MEDSSRTARARIIVPKVDIESVSDPWTAPRTAEVYSLAPAIARRMAAEIGKPARISTEVWPVAKIKSQPIEIFWRCRVLRLIPTAMADVVSFWTRIF
jgi:hypothetical protein